MSTKYSHVQHVLPCNAHVPLLAGELRRLLPANSCNDSGRRRYYNVAIDPGKVRDSSRRLIPWTSRVKGDDGIVHFLVHVPQKQEHGGKLLSRATLQGNSRRDYRAIKTCSD